MIDISRPKSLTPGGCGGAVWISLRSSAGCNSNATVSDHGVCYIAWNKMNIILFHRRCITAYKTAERHHNTEFIFIPLAVQDSTHQQWFNFA